MTIIEQKPQFGVNYDIGFDGFTSRQKDFLAAGINWFAHWDVIPGVPPVSHTFKIVGEDTTIEAFGDGVRYGKLSNYLNDPTCALIVRKPAGWTPELGLRMAKEAEKHLGEKYNWFLIAALAISNSYLGKWIDKKLKGKFSNWLTDWADNAKSNICSSLIARVNGAMPEYEGKSVLANPPYKIMPIMLCGDPILYEYGAIELIP
ncbi:MAG TPA: hypothetical protein PLC59_02320 [Bacteroidales bacterium]|jgi:hypothetical protein|nr:hypothetical protein [Bacteroidales bacterium]